MSRARSCSFLARRDVASLRATLWRRRRRAAGERWHPRHRGLDRGATALEAGAPGMRVGFEQSSRLAHPATRIVLASPIARFHPVTTRHLISRRFPSPRVTTEDHQNTSFPRETARDRPPFCVTVFQFLSPRLKSRETDNEISCFELLLGFRCRLVSTFVTSTATACCSGHQHACHHERMAREPDFINELRAGSREQSTCTHATSACRPSTAVGGAC